MKTKEIAMIELDPTGGYFLECDPNYLTASDLERFTVCNGCGGAKSKFDFVPDTIWCMPIREACLIHDWDYHHGKTVKDRMEADMRFLKNMLTLIEQRSGFLLRVLRRRRAMKYYEAVRELGSKAFWANKPNKPIGDKGG